MCFQVIIAVFAGILLGITVMYCMQRRQREEELRKITKLTEDILKGQEIKAAASGEETLKTIRNSLGQIQSWAEAKEIQFEITFPKTAVCKHDANWLGEAIYNILDNAVKYSEPGGKVEVQYRRMRCF